MPMSFLPPELEQYSSIINMILLLVDGLLIGVALKKAVVSIVLFAIAIVLAGAVGLSLPFTLTTGDILTHVTNIFWSQWRHMGFSIAAYPLAWLAGLALGIWKG